MLKKKAEELARLLIGKNITVSSAESCTGGLFAKTLTDIPGVSAIFPGGVVSYSNEIKEKLLGVRKETLEKFGAVSEETALQMADGVRALMGTALGVSATGIAGPGSDATDKPVGLVYIALSTPDGTFPAELRLSGSREEIRNATVGAVMDLILEKYGTRTV